VPPWSLRRPTRSPPYHRAIAEREEQLAEAHAEELTIGLLSIFWRHREQLAEASGRLHQQTAFT